MRGQSLKKYIFQGINLHNIPLNELTSAEIMQEVCLKLNALGGFFCQSCPLKSFFFSGCQRNSYIIFSENLEPGSRSG